MQTTITFMMVLFERRCASIIIILTSFFGLLMLMYSPQNPGCVPSKKGWDHKERIPLQNRQDFQSLKTKNPILRRFTKNNIKNNSIIYILEWYPIYTSQLYLTEQTPFIRHDCELTNCFITNNRNYFTSFKDFDAVLFSDFDTTLMTTDELPKNRYLHQKYVFFAQHPTYISWNRGKGITNTIFDDFFNYTWTYRLDSDFPWKFIDVQYVNGSVIGPKLGLNWSQMSPDLDEEFKLKLESKNKAVAWLLSKCSDWREKYILDTLTEALQPYNLTVDFFNKRCSKLQCGVGKYSIECSNLLKKNYYFVFAYENLCDEDYVTDSPLLALNNDAVPIVFGAADYSRFLPPNSYLNYRVLGAQKMAAVVNESIANHSMYHSYFSWRNQYRFTSGHLGVCDLCEGLNSGSLGAGGWRRQSFRSWWNSQRSNRC